MRLEIEKTQADERQRKYARLAGFLFLAVIIMALGSGFILSHIARSGTFAEIGKRIASSEHLYRAMLAAGVVATLGSALLAFALYATLKPFNGLLAELAMIFSLGDSFLALVVRMCDFVRLHLYASAGAVAAGPMPAQALSDLVRNIASSTENIGGIAFGIGSFLFFYLFFQSRYIPSLLAAMGVFASAIWVGLYFAGLVFPEERSVFSYICFPPMGIADILTGLYLVRFAVKTQGSGDQLSQQASIAGKSL